MNRQTKFNPKWIDELEASSWLSGGGRENEAICTACNATLNISQSGIQIIKNHMKTAKHNKNLTSCRSNSSINRYIYRQPKNSVDDQASTLTIKAEIMWTWQAAYKSKSFAGEDQASKLFAAMFPDSKIAKSFQCGRTKLSYLLNCAIAPFAKEEIKKSVCESGFYSVSFDESDGNMMVCIRHINEGQILVDMLDFFKLDAFDAESCAAAIRSCVHEKGLAFSKWIGDFSDNCNVMRGAYSGVLKCLRNYPELKHLVDVGGCTLHIVANAARIAVEKNLHSVVSVSKSRFQRLY